MGLKKGKKKHLGREQDLGCQGQIGDRNDLNQSTFKSAIYSFITIYLQYLYQTDFAVCVSFRATVC